MINEELLIENVYKFLKTIDEINAHFKDESKISKKYLIGFNMFNKKYKNSLGFSIDINDDNNTVNIYEKIYIPYVGQTTQWLLFGDVDADILGDEAKTRRYYHDLVSFRIRTKKTQLHFMLAGINKKLNKLNRYESELDDYFEDVNPFMDDLDNDF